MFNRVKCQVCVIFIIAVASFRFRQMILAQYLSKGSYFQHLEFLINAFLGMCWVRSDFVRFSVKLLLGWIFINISNIYFSFVNIEELESFGTYRTKYLVEAIGKWPEEKIVQAETFMEVMLTLIVIKALDVVGKQLVEMEEEKLAKEAEKNE